MSAQYNTARRANVPGAVGWLEGRVRRNDRRRNARRARRGAAALLRLKYHEYPPVETGPDTLVDRQRESGGTALGSDGGRAARRAAADLGTDPLLPGAGARNNLHDARGARHAGGADLERRLRACLRLAGDGASMVGRSRAGAGRVSGLHVGVAVRDAAVAVAARRG